MKGKLPEPGKVSVAEVEKIDGAVKAANASGKAESASEMAKKLEYLMTQMRLVKLQ